MDNFIVVRATDPTRCALWEVATEHPGGEVFVSGVESFKVGRTSLVARRIKEGLLVEVSGPATAPEEDTTQKQTTPEARAKADAEAQIKVQEAAAAQAQADAYNAPKVTRNANRG